MSSGTVDNVNTDPDDWRRVWAAIDRRREELGWTFAQLYRTTKVSEATIRPLRMYGTAIVRTDVKRKLTDGLGWTHDSIDRILRGEQPIAAPPDRPKPSAAGASTDTKLILNAVAGATEDVTKALEDVDRRLRALAAAVRSVERQLAEGSHRAAASGPGARGNAST